MGNKNGAVCGQIRSKKRGSLLGSGPLRLPFAPMRGVGEERNLCMNATRRVYRSFSRLFKHEWCQVRLSKTWAILQHATMRCNDSPHRRETRVSNRNMFSNLLDFTVEETPT